MNYELNTSIYNKHINTPILDELAITAYRIGKTHRHFTMCVAFVYMCL